ncbi:MAG: Flp pilus assembly protein CpaB [Bryobacterales bacterium]|nr:Flp pilus assembly protein CpaB [Bryobacterales bacterium]
MKTNWVPLLAIALVVAILATGVFYGLVASRLNEVEASAPVAETSATPSAAAIPPGFRAITVHVADSLGLLGLLKPGQRVDVQAIWGPPHAVELRTVAQNLAILDVQAQPEATPGRPALPVVTLLVTPEDADVVALADSAAKVRLALRSAADSGVEVRPSLGIVSIMRTDRQAASVVPTTSSSPPARHAAPPRLSLASPGGSATAP